ncbi:MAG: CBS domain-containing protein [Gammaproteobacteria bacterium]|nr:CBS domain-containing protein [Gammaproteobacteria bacterium]
MDVDNPVAEVMTPHPRVVQITDRISDVRAILADGRVHHLPVVEGGKLVGMITTTDLLEFGFAPRDSHTDLDEYLDNHFSIPQIMQTELITVPSDSTIRDAARALTTGRLHAVPVVKSDGELVGIVTSTDIVSFVVSQD